MNIPALRGQIGNTVYYLANLSMSQVNDIVKPVDNELHTAFSLREQIQRSLSNNYLKIKDYIIAHEDRFFNSLVLAIYDGNPLWTEIRYELDGNDYSNVGIIHLNGQEKIFPVDGQHRVQGIKEALKNKPELSNETISVILISHSTSPEGMEKSRRIFSTLNRYAKPVGLGDIIALDEDDMVAISTRVLLENHNLFKADRVKAYNSIAIPVADKKSFTSLIALYKCNLSLFFSFYYTFEHKKISSSKVKDFLRSRPSDTMIDSFTEYLSNIWSTISTTFSSINHYSSDNRADSAAQFRPRKEGGNVFFRPVFLIQFISAISQIAIRSNNSIENIIKSLSSIEVCVSAKPWDRIIWDPIKQTMITRNGNLVFLLLIHMYNSDLLTDRERQALHKGIQSVLNYNRDFADEYIRTFNIKLSNNQS